MASALTPTQVEQFRHDGFLAPLPCLTREEAAHYRARLEAYEEEVGGRITEIDRLYRYKVHLREPWCYTLAAHPAVLDALEPLLGPDILIYTTAFFIKEPHSEGITAPHQDATHFGYARQEGIAAWIALSDASHESGCMSFVRGSHRLGQLFHRSEAHPNSINGGGQMIAEPFDATDSVAAPLQAGEFSLHHCLCIHSSPPNRADDRRIGLSVHYVPADVPNLAEGRATATLVRGEDRHGFYDLETPPGPAAGAETRAAQDEAGRRYRANYAAQQARHAREFAPRAPH